MPRQNKKLTDLEIRNAKPKATDYKLYDESGLRLLIRKSGTKVWQYPYRFNGKWNIHTIGKHGDITTVEARAKRDEAKRMLEEGIDPNHQKKAIRIKREYEHKNSFEAIAREWYEKQSWAEKHAANILSRLELDAFPIIGRQPVNKITRQEVLHILQNIENRGSCDVAKRIGQYCSAIFDYALLKGLCDSNPAMGLAKIVKTNMCACRRRRQFCEYQLGHCLSLSAAYRPTLNQRQDKRTAY